MLMRLLRQAAAIALLIGGTLQPAAAAEFDAAEKSEIESIVRDYLLKNPGLLLEVMEKLEEEQKQAARNKASEAIVANRTELFESDGDYVFNAKGTVPIVEFFDYQCGYCKRMLPTVVRLLDENPEVRFIFKEFPILGPASLVASKAALAARRQGKYLDFHNALMALRRPLSEDAVYDTAAQVGLDVEKLKSDMASPEIQAVIERNRQLGQDMGIRGTPSLVVGDALVPGAIEYGSLAALVERMSNDCQVC